MITLATLHEYSAQQVFDYISRHLLTQGEKCQDFDDDMNPVCVYRNSDGQICAAGCLIGEKEYSQSIEGTGWRTHVENGKVPSVHSKLISRLQEVHDGCSAAGWYKALQCVAGDYYFNTTNLDMYAEENNYC